MLNFCIKVSKILFFSLFALKAESINLQTKTGDIHFKSFYASFYAEIDCDAENIAFVDKNIICLVDKKSNHVKEIFNFSQEQQIIPKIGLANKMIVFTNENAEIKAIDFDGKEVFSKNLPEVSRSDIVFSSGNIFISLINQFVLCFSLKGEILWVNKDFFNKNVVYKNQIIVGKQYVYFLNKAELSLLSKKTGLRLSGNDNFKSAKTFYVDDNNLKAYSVSNDNFIYYDLLNEKIHIDEKMYFPKKMVSQNVEYSYENGVLKNLQNGEELKCELTDFKFFDNKIFAYEHKGKKLIVIKGKDLFIYNLDFCIRKLIYKNNTLIIWDYNVVYWSDIKL